MIKLGITVFLLSLSYLQCSFDRLKHEAINTPTGNVVEFSQKPYEICDKKAFEGACDTLNQIIDPFVVREIKGRLISGSIGDIWPEGYKPLFEIQGIGEGTKIKKVFPDISGRFAIKNIPEGRYCFLASCYGWQGELGIIIVDKKANKKKEIIIEMQMD